MAQGSAGIASLEARAKVVKLGIWAVVAVTVPLIGLYGILFTAYLDIYYPSLALLGLIARANALLYAVLALSAVAVLFWVHRAHANLHDLTLEDLTYSPGWAVGCWFVPFINLVVPFSSMRELYNRSHGEESWNAAAAVGDITSWWTFQIASGFILAFTTLTWLINILPGIWLTTPPAADAGLNIAGFAMLAGSGLYLRKIVTAITNAQRHGAGSASIFE